DAAVLRHGAAGAAEAAGVEGRSEPRGAQAALQAVPAGGAREAGGGGGLRVERLRRRGEVLGRARGNVDGGYVDEGAGPGDEDLAAGLRRRVLLPERGLLPVAGEHPA